MTPADFAALVSLFFVLGVAALAPVVLANLIGDL